MDPGDWRNQLQRDSRQKIISKIMETLKRQLPVSGPEGTNELRRIAARFEEKIYANAVNQTDYLRKISMKMLTLEKSQNNVAGPSPSVPKQLLDSASTSIQPQVQTQGQSLPISLPANQSQTPPQLLPQNMQTNIASGAQGFASLPSSIPQVSALSNANIPGVLGQNSNMQNVPGMLQDTSGTSMGQGVPSNMFANSQRQMMGRSQVMSSQQQQQPQLQQLQQQLLKQNFRQGSHPNSLLPSHVQQQQQQQQQNVLQPNQLHSSQQAGIPTSSVMQPSGVNSAPPSGLQPNQQLQQPAQSMLRQHQQSILRQHQQSQQDSGIHPQQTSLPQQSMSPLQQQQQQQLLRQQAANSGSIQQTTLGDMQQQQQHPQRLLSQQNTLPNIQQQHQQTPQQQQPLMTQQNNLQAMHQQQLGPQNNASGLQQQPQQQLLGNQVGNLGMQNNQQSIHMLSQAKVPLHQKAHPAGPGALATQGQQPQPQPSQQQMMPQMQAQSSQLQQLQPGLQQPTNLLQHDMQQRLQASAQASGALLQPQNVMDQQKQLYQPQRALPEMPSSSLDSTAQTGNANGGDWQEEVYQKIKAMKEMYLPELNEIYHKVAAKLQQHDSLPQQPKSDQFEKLKLFKNMLERMITFLSVTKNNILPPLKDKLNSYEKQIINFLQTNRMRRPVQQGQQPQSQITQGQSHDNQLNAQLQPMNMQGSVPRTQQSSMTSLQHNSLPSLPGVLAPQQNMSTSMPGSSLEPGQGNGLNTSQQVPTGPIQQSSGSIAQQVNNNPNTSQSGVTTLQPNVNPAQNTNMLQHQHLKQQQEQQMTQQLKQQLQQRQVQQHLLHKQQLLQQQQQQQLQARQQIAQLQQMNDVNDISMRHGMNVKPGMFQQHLAQGQRSAYPLQQLKPGSQLPASSPQLPQGASPQIGQHSSPQVDQKNLLASSFNKMGTPSQSANSPFVVPSPSTPLAPSPMPVDSEKPVSGTSSFPNAGNVARQQTVSGVAPTQSLAIGTPGISASPLLQEFTSPDGNSVHPLKTVSCKSSITEQPLERLMKAVSSISSKALSASVSDIESVVSMTDRIAGSAPGNGSRASVGEDLVAMTKCRLQARNFITQDGMTGTRKLKRQTTAMPLSVVSSAGSISDNFKQLTGSETSELESTATSCAKRPRIKINHALFEEIREINQRLIDTVVGISDEDADPSTRAIVPEGGEGTIVKCSFTAVALSPSLKSHFSSMQLPPIQPLCLLVPPSYPKCSPILLDKLPVEISKENEDLSLRARSQFSRSLRSLSQPMSLKDIARTWDACARAVISEYAQQHGGGTFSSKYGTWENCSTAA